MGGELFKAEKNEGCERAASLGEGFDGAKPSTDLSGFKLNEVAGAGSPKLGISEATGHDVAGLTELARACR
jgi:hypothetical protein